MGDRNEDINLDLDAASLHDEDRDAIDAYFEHAGDPPAGASDRGDRVASLLGLLATPVAEEGSRGTRMDLIELRAAQRTGEPTLCLGSRHAVDDHVNGKAPETRTDAAHDALADAVTSGPSIDGVRRAELVERTLAAIQDEIDRSKRRHIMDLPVIPGGRVRLADLVSLAAMILLAASVIIPVMGGVRDRQFRAQCQDHLADVGTSFGLYAGSNGDILPMATAGFSGRSTWMDVGTTPERSNSSNLFVVVREGYADLEDLACPTNPHALVDAPVESMHDWRSLDEISYSYRIMTRGGLKVHEVQNPDRVVVLADRSPVVLRMAAGEPILPEENTPNHDARGQHVLRLDASSGWHARPVLDRGDNLWLPRGVERMLYEVRDRLGIIEGNEMPSGPTDAFVAP